MIPPLLGFYAKFFIIASLANTNNLFLAIFIIICSVISCLRYLNIIQISNFKFNGTKYSNAKNDLKSYIIAILTCFLTFSFLNPIYFISTLSYLKI